MSFEFFPPRTPEATARLKTTRRKLNGLNPGFFSVTFGAGGRTRDLTLETVLEIRDDTGVDSAPHVSRFGFPIREIRAGRERYQQAGIRRRVAPSSASPATAVYRTSSAPRLNRCATRRATS